MASKVVVTTEALVNRFHEYAECTDKKDKNKFTTAACGKMIQNALLKDLSKFEVKNRIEGSAFPHCAKANGGKFFEVTENNVQAFVRRCAYEVAKKKTRNEKLPENDKEVDDMEQKIKTKICAQGPVISGTKTVKVGNVEGLTDVSGYTGSHKERFGKDGKGLGGEGRKDIHKNDGYVQGFKK